VDSIHGDCGFDSSCALVKVYFLQFSMHSWLSVNGPILIYSVDIYSHKLGIFPPTKRLDYIIELASRENIYIWALVWALKLIDAVFKFHMLAPSMELMLFASQKQNALTITKLVVSCLFNILKSIE
jgi:hypothetical protein